MTKKVSTPALRFKGFTYTWKQRKLSDQFSDFIVPMRDKPKKFGGNIPWTRIEDIEGKYLNGSLSGQFVSKDTIKQMNLKIIPKDSLIVSSSATFGVVAIITQDLITNQTFIGLVPNDKETLDFWYTFFHSNEARNYMRLQSAGSTIFYIAREHFEKMPIIIPFKDEMITIGKYFSNLDRLITLHQRKYDKLTNMKKSMLEKMFPKNGANVPEIRFKGFTDAWEQRKLGECTDLLTGHPFESKQFSENGVLLIRGMNVKRNELDTSPEICEYWHTTEGLEKYLLSADDILIQMDGALIGKSYAKMPKNKLPALLVQRVTRARTKNDYDNDFIYQSLQRDFLTYIQGIKTETAVPHLSLNDIFIFKIYVPSLAEQKKIGSCFRNLDNLITLHQRELEKLKNLKKACLEKMFV